MGFLERGVAAVVLAFIPNPLEAMGKLGSRRGVAFLKLDIRDLSDGAISPHLGVIHAGRLRYFLFLSRGQAESRHSHERGNQSRKDWRGDPAERVCQSILPKVRRGSPRANSRKSYFLNF